MDKTGAGERKCVTKNFLIVLLVIGAFVIGYHVSSLVRNSPGPAELNPSPSSGTQKPNLTTGPAAEKNSHLWTCSMHPQIRLPNPGKCPICFMDLIPLETGLDTAGEVSGRQYAMSEAAKKLAEVETARVRRDRAKIAVNMVGMIFEDETRIAALTSRVDGRLDEIYVNFTGVMVNVGDPMVTIWSPMLIRSQVELFETLRAQEPDEDLIRGAEEKLIQQGLTKDQIAEIKEKKKPINYVTLRAPINGVVVKKMAVLGQFVKEGQEMYTINDLSRVWVKLDAYETDMPWIRYGQDLTSTTPAVPGRTFKGKVLFIDPMLDTRTRSVKIRVEAENPDLMLKPGMFVTARLEAEIDEKGRVIKPEWAGKYVCPVHPTEQVSSIPGVCQDSKLALKPASAYGYLDDPNPVFPLVIPAAAPLITGKRAIVYVEIPDADRPTYELREVVLGPRAGDRYVVYQGLKEGERVVTKGNFKIDSAMQILGKASMMKPDDPKYSAGTAQKPQDEELIEKIDVPHEFLKALSPAIDDYLALKDALVDEKLGDAAASAKRLLESLRKIHTGDLDTKAQDTWKQLLNSMESPLKRMDETKDVETLRKAFDPFSEAFVRMLMSFGHATSEPVVVFHCPMAFDSQGAYWVERGEERRNPYFGRKPYKGQDMLQCGELVEKIPPEVRPTPASAGSDRPAHGESDDQDRGSGSKSGNIDRGSGAKD